MKPSLLLVLLVWILSASSVVRGEAPPELILIGDRVHTLAPAQSPAQAIAVGDGRILVVGEAEAIRQLAGPTTEIRTFAGGTIVPGLIDAHGHMSGLGSYGFGLLDL
ncbi:MAG: hypothetical protein HZB38_02575, partial [Planctomycetes bacterium]|nr:hypothetical protein [Planctomycetota bacterium]